MKIDGKVSCLDQKNTSFSYHLKRNMRNMIIFNKKKILSVPEYNNWTDDMTNSFNKICGLTMLKLRYK